MAIWKVIALVSGNIEAVSGPAAQDRPGTHEWMVWQGTAVIAWNGLDSFSESERTLCMTVPVSQAYKPNHSARPAEFDYAAPSS